LVSQKGEHHLARATYRFALYRRIVCAAIALLFIFGVTRVPEAHAAYWDDVYQGFEQFSRLPGDVYQLKESYRQTQEDLEKARTSIETYQKQNVQLLEQNRKLNDTVTELKNLQTQRDQASHRNKMLIITAVILLAGYFIGIRLLRYGMRRRSGRY
jgi:cell shape-determining protein MreC